MSQATKLLGSLRLTPLRVRDVSAVILGTLVVAGFCGLTVMLAFDRYSTAKWAVTVAGPIALLLLILSQRPRTWLAVLVILALPFADFEVSFAGIRTGPVHLLLAVALPLVTLTNRPSWQQPSSSLSKLGPWVVVVLIPATLLGSLAGDTLWTIGTVAAVSFIASQTIRTEEGALLAVVAAVVLSAAIQGVLGIQEFITGRPLDLYGSGVASYASDYFFGYDGVFRPSGAFRDPISLGNVLAVSIPLAVALSGCTLLRTSLRVASFCCALAATGGLALTLSRASWMGAVLGLLVMCGLSPQHRRTQMFASVVAASGLVVLTASLTAGPALISRFSSISDPTASSVETAEGDLDRLEFWAASWRVFTEHTWTGVGIGELNNYLLQMTRGATLYTHAHSTYLQFLAEVGILGGVLVSSLFICVVRDLRRAGVGKHRLPPDALVHWLSPGASGAIVTVAVMWTTDFTVRYVPVASAVALIFVLVAQLCAASRATINEVPAKCV